MVFVSCDVFAVELRDNWAANYKQALGSSQAPYTPLSSCNSTNTMREEEGEGKGWGG